MNTNETLEWLAEYCHQQIRLAIEQARKGRKEEALSRLNQVSIYLDRTRAIIQDIQTT